jgi:pimeloyl-ACP methyl ester carboxylesterase
LRAGLSYFGAAFEDEKYFTAQVNRSKLRMPVLAMGGEASFAPEDALRANFADVAENLTTFVIPKAGHWIVSEAYVFVSGH